MSGASSKNKQVGTGEQVDINVAMNNASGAEGGNSPDYNKATTLHGADSKQTNYLINNMQSNLVQ